MTLLCDAHECDRPATTSVDGWLFTGPTNRCDQHRDSLMVELRRMGWTRPFVLAAPGAWNWRASMEAGS